MDRKSIRGFPFFIFASLFLLFFTACELSRPAIIGTWKDTVTGETIEFTAGGTVIVRSMGYAPGFDYALIGNETIKIKLGKADNPYDFNDYPATYWTYRISGDNITITADGYSRLMHRVATKNSTPSIGFPFPTRLN